MPETLLQRGEFSFCLHREFEGRFLAPVIANFAPKAGPDWDDYNEPYHCAKLIDECQRAENVTHVYHTLERAGEVQGLLMASFGAIKRPPFFPQPAFVRDEEGDFVLLSYFHIMPCARGNGGFWLREAVLPYYAARGFRAAYIRSSHEKTFPLYARFGEAVGEYTATSDNGWYTRAGRVFRFPLDTHTR